MHNPLPTVSERCLPPAEETPEKDNSVKSEDTRARRELKFESVSQMPTRSPSSSVSDHKNQMFGFQSSRDDDPIQEPSVALGQNKKAQDELDEDLPKGALGPNGQPEQPNAGLQDPKVDIGHSNGVLPIPRDSDDAHQVPKVVMCVSEATQGAGIELVLTSDMGEMVLPQVKPIPTIILEDSSTEIVGLPTSASTASLPCNCDDRGSELVTGF